MKGISLLAASVLLALPLLGQAYDAYTVDNVRLQAGPDEEYPTITELPAGAEVSLQGCIDGWSWCDVIAGDDRGWVPASYLEEEYDNRRVLVVDYGPRIGIPVVGFSLGVYWDRHYHNRPWYHERARWEQRHITPRALPRPTTAARGGEIRAGASVSEREQHERRGSSTTSGNVSARGSVGASAEINRRDTTRGDEHARDTSRSASSNTAQTSGSQASGSNPSAQSPKSSARISQDNYALKNAKDHGEHDTNQTAQSNQQAVPNVRQDEREGARNHQMPPQVQTARNNTPTQQPQAQSRPSEQGDRGRHEGERKGEKKNDKDRDRDNNDH